MIKKAIKEALEEFVKSAEFELAINRALMREFELERTDAAGRVEKIKETANVLDVLAIWLRNAEGAIRGCQADAASARNKATQTRDLILSLADDRARLEPPEKILEIE